MLKDDFNFSPTRIELVSIIFMYDKRKVFEGDLSFLNLGDLLQLLSTDSRTGILTLYNSSFNEPGIIYIKNGNPFDASSQNLQGIKALYSLFGWISGRFEFVQEDFTRIDCIKKRMMAIVLDALRVLDEGGINKYNDNDINKEIDNNPKGCCSSIKGPFIEYSSVVDEDEYPDGSNIVTQGRHGNWLWVILDGYVDICKQTENGKTLIMTSGPGAFIGNLSTILQPDNTRSATAIANGQVQLGVIDTQKIYNELSYIDDEFKKVIISFDNRLKKVTDRFTDFKSGLNKNEDLPKNTKILINQGDNVQKVFKIIQGEAYIVKKTESKATYLMTLGKDDYIGNIPFLSLDYEPFSMSIYATDNLKLDIIDLDKLNSEYEKLSVTVKNIIEYTSMCISVTTKNACAQIILM